MLAATMGSRVPAVSSTPLRLTRCAAPPQNVKAIVCSEFSTGTTSGLHSPWMLNECCVLLVEPV